MKKENVINLIKYHISGNEQDFKNEAYEIAVDFNNSGDEELSDYILSMIQDYKLYPQFNENYKYLSLLEANDEPLLLPDVIKDDLISIANALDNEVFKINKFLLKGRPGTGKTEAVKQLGRLLNKDVYKVEISNVIDSKLGQTSKNINELFSVINKIANPSNSIVLLDEIDALALDRINNNDIREMGRATSEVLNGLDNVKNNIIILATTNLYSKLDKAIIRRFDYVIDFDRYTKEDLIDVANNLLNYYLGKYKVANKDKRIFDKILKSVDTIPSPADLKNIIKTSIAFSDPKDGNDYLRKFYKKIANKKDINIKDLQSKNFTLREMEVMIGKSKSSIDRLLRGMNE